MLSVRLPKEIEYELERLAESKHATKSDLVKEAVAQYLIAEKVETNSYEAGKSLFGNNGSNETDKSTTYKKYVKEKLNDKYFG